MHRGWTKSCTALKPWEPLLVGAYRGIIITRFHGWSQPESRKASATRRHFPKGDGGGDADFAGPGALCVP